MTQSGSCIDPCSENVHHALGLRCRLSMFEILLRLSFLFIYYYKNHLTHVSARKSDLLLFSMDPRRARDPRLARVDPRVQPSGSPASSTPPPTPYNAQGSSSQPPQQWNENGAVSVPSSAQATPQPQSCVSTSSNSQVTQTPTTSGPQESAPVFKGRPLFCVVCASNQVGD